MGVRNFFKLHYDPKALQHRVAKKNYTFFNFYTLIYGFYLFVYNAIERSNFLKLHDKIMATIIWM